MPPPSAVRRDVLLALLVFLGALLNVVLANSMGAFAFPDPPSLAEQCLWAAALTLPLALRRAYPVVPAVVIGAALIAAQYRHSGDNLVPSVTVFLALYSLGAWGRDRRVATWVRLGVIAAMFAWLGVSLAQAAAGPPVEFDDAAGPLDPQLAAMLYTIAFNVMFFLSAHFFGNQAWVSARREHELRVRAEELRRSREDNARRAVVEERIRIARDLHDVVAHHVSVMGVQAAAARRVLGSDPEVARAALGTVEQTARTAIGELRGLLGVLRRPAPADDDSAAPLADESATPGHPPSPGLDDLPRLVADSETPLLHTRYAIFGEERPVPQTVALSVYRVVQEALTNTVKHAHARTVDVRVRFLERDLEVEVTDDGRARAGVPAAAGAGAGAGPGDPAGGDRAGGLGQIGMRERVTVHGGELEVGPRRDGGYRVRARFPLERDGLGGDRDERTER